MTSDRRTPFWFLDSRSLGLFRIILGLVAFYTFAQMAVDAAAFFGPGGVMPAGFAWEGYTVKPWLFGLLFAFPESMAPVVLAFVLGMGGCLLLVFGPGARVGSLLAWWAFGCLTVRNPLVLHAGDSLLSIMLFVAAFLPVNRHFSLPSIGRQEPVLVTNFFTAVWVVQISVVYLAAAVVKVVVSSWRDGTHLQLLFSGTELVTPIGRWMSQFPVAGWLGTISSLIFEFAIGLFLLLPSAWQRLRLWLVAIGICFHLMIALTLQVGLFPIYSLAALCTFLPPLFWERLRRGKASAPAPFPPVLPARGRRWQLAAAVPVAVAIAWIGLGNAWPAIPAAPQPIAAAFHQLQWKHNWNVFAEKPVWRTRLGVELVLRNGQRIDLIEGANLVPAQFDALPSESDRFGGSRWRFLLFGNFVSRPQLRPFAVNYLQHLAARHAENPALRGASWELVLYSAPLPRVEPQRISREVIASYSPPQGAARE